MQKIDAEVLVTDLRSGKYLNGEANHLDSMVVDGDLLIDFRDIRHLFCSAVIFNGNVTIQGVDERSGRESLTFLSCRFNGDLLVCHLVLDQLNLFKCNSEHTFNLEHVEVTTKFEVIASEFSELTLLDFNAGKFDVNGLRVEESLNVGDSKLKSASFVNGSRDIRINFAHTEIGRLHTYDSNEVEEPGHYSIDLYHSSVQYFVANCSVYKLTIRGTISTKCFELNIGSERDGCQLVILDSRLNEIFVNSKVVNILRIRDSSISSDVTIEGYCETLVFQGSSARRLTSQDLFECKSIAIEGASLRELTFLACNTNKIVIIRSRLESVLFLPAVESVEDKGYVCRKNIVHSQISIEFCSIINLSLLSLEVGNKNAAGISSLRVVESSVDELYLSEPDALTLRLNQYYSMNINDVVALGFNAFLVKYNNDVLFLGCDIKRLSLGGISVIGEFGIYTSVIRKLEPISRKSEFYVAHNTNTHKYDYSAFVSVVKIYNSEIQSDVDIVNLAVIARGDERHNAILIDKTKIVGNLVLANLEGMATFITRPISLHDSDIGRLVFSKFLSSFRLRGNFSDSAFLSLDGSNIDVIELQSELPYYVSVKYTKVLDLDCPFPCIKFLSNTLPFNKDLYLTLESKYATSGEIGLSNDVYVAMRRKERSERRWVGTKAWDYFLDFTTCYGTRSSRLLVALVLMLAFSLVLLSNPEHIQPTTEAVDVYPDIHSHTTPPEWGAIDSLWVSVRYLMPMLSNFARSDWEPSDSVILMGLSPEDIMNFFLYLSWVIWPLLLASASGFMRK